MPQVVVNLLAVLVYTGYNLFEYPATCRKRAISVQSHKVYGEEGVNRTKSILR
jgi:hypothetical protein